MIDSLDVLITIINISVGALTVNIRSLKLSAVMVDRTLTHHRTNRPLNKNPPFSSFAFVTFCESNAKALSASQKRPCALRGADFPSALPVTVVTIVTVF